MIDVWVTGVPDVPKIYATDHLKMIDSQSGDRRHSQQPTTSEPCFLILYRDWSAKDLYSSYTVT